MSPTVEVRWFFDAGPWTIPDVIKEGSQISTRIDWYAPSTDRSGVKLRQGNIEPKLLLGEVGVREMAGAVGRLQSWRKWTYAVEPGELPPADLLRQSDWIPVKKNRALAAFTIEDGGPKPASKWPESGCQFEWTLISIGDGDRWYTVGFEAFGGKIDLESALVATAEMLIPDLPSGLPLTEKNSLSYPEWLSTLYDRRAGLLH